MAVRIRGRWLYQSRYRVDDSGLYLDIPKWLETPEDRQTIRILRLPAFVEPSSNTREPSRALVARPRTVDLVSRTVDHGPGTSGSGNGRAPLTSSRLCSTKMQHAWCDGRMHVPLSLHHEFQRTAPDGFDLSRWYGDTDLAWADKPIGDDGFTFWRARWREEHGTTQQTDAQLKRAAQRKRDLESEQ